MQQTFGLAGIRSPLYQARLLSDPRIVIAQVAMIALGTEPTGATAHVASLSVGLRERKAGATYALRWEASGPAGGLFPVLDADLSLIRVDASRTRPAATWS